MSAHPPESKVGKLRSLRIDRLQRGEFQPRRVIDGAGLTKLAESIRSKGLLQPVYVRKGRHGKFEIIAGERRWHAARIAGLKEIPTIVGDVSDEAALAIGLIENLHREEFNAIDQAKAMNRLVEELGMTHQDVADTIGTSLAVVSNLIRLLELPEAVRELIANGDIDMSHALALLALPAEQRTAAAERMRDKPLIGDSDSKGPSTDDESELVSVSREQDGRYHVSFTVGTPSELDRAIERLRQLSADL